MRGRKAWLHRGVQHRVPTGIDHPQDGERRQQQRGEREDPQTTQIPGAKPQPHVQSDASVNPHDEQQRELSGEVDDGISHPEEIENAKVGILEPIEEDPEPGVRDMRRQQQRDGEAETQLPRLDRWHAQVSSPIESAQSERDMDQERGQQDHEADPGPPRREQDIVTDRLDAGQTK